MRTRIKCGLGTEEGSPMRRKDRVSRVMVIGLDAPIAPRVYAYAREGKLPTLARLMREGVHAVNCLVPFPTITPPNWTTIATGAWPGTHGITGYDQHTPGDPLDDTHPGFDSRECRSEYLWTAAERVGKRSIILNYPSSWPPTIKEGIQVGGAGLSVDGWRTESPHGTTVAGDQVFATEFYPLGRQIEVEMARGWDNLPPGQRVLEAQLPLRFNQPAYPVVEGKTWHMLILDSKGQGYDTVLLAQEKDFEATFARLQVGEWTPNLTQTFRTIRGDEEAVFRCKLLELSPDGQEFKLYVTTLSTVERATCLPQSIADELKSEEGLPGNRAGYSAYTLEWIDLDTLVEAAEFQHIFLADAAEYLLTNKPWDLFFMHAHAPDWMYHTFATQMDPATAASTEEAERHGAAELRIYQSLDSMIGRMVACGGEQALVVVTSDHGAKADNGEFSPYRALEVAGLLSYTEDDDGETVIDWSRTKAIPQRYCYVYVNLKGRDPEGIVEPGEEFEQVCDRVIAALYDCTDTETGRKPVTLALRRKDARIIGLYGEMIGDVVYAIDPGFGHQHGPHLPTAEWGVGSQKGLFIMSGPGVKRGHVLERTVWLTDIAPTICYLAELPVPKDCEGAIIYQALEDPNRHLTELADLRKNFGRLRRAYEGIQAETHRYRK